MLLFGDRALNMQSPWVIDGQRKGESSVEEHIADAVLPHFKADKHKFMTAGQHVTIVTP